jgi:hypothetical protein
MQSARKRFGIINGNISKAAFLSNYEHNEGFTVRIADFNDADFAFSGDTKLRFACCNVVEQSKDVMIFWPPRASTCSFDSIFHTIADVQYVCLPHCQGASKDVLGDTASGQLYGAYLKRSKDLMATVNSSRGE